MSFDAHANLCATLITNSPGTGGTSFTVTTGTGALFPTAPFNCTVWLAPAFPVSASGQLSVPSSVLGEIVRVTSITGDTLTVSRAQESTTALNVVAGWTIANTITALDITTIENATGGGSGNVTTSGNSTANQLAHFTTGTNVEGITLSGDGSISNTGALTITKSNSVPFGNAAFVSTTTFDAAGAAAAAQAASYPGLAAIIPTTAGGTGSNSNPTLGQVPVGNAGGTAYAPGYIPRIGYEFVSLGATSGAITSTMTALLEGSGTEARIIGAYDASLCTQARVIVNIGSTAANNTTRVGVRYYTASSDTFSDYLTAGNSGEIDVALTTSASTCFVGSWLNLVAGAKADVFWILTAIDSANAGRTPTICRMEVQFR
jgi:hypothetical protein